MKFEIFKDTSGEWRFRLKARNGKTIATGESYKRRAGVMKTIHAIKTDFAYFQIPIFENGAEVKI